MRRSAYLQRFPIKIFSDLKGVLHDLGQNYDLGEEDHGHLQEYCPTCKRIIRGAELLRKTGQPLLVGVRNVGQQGCFSSRNTISNFNFRSSGSRAPAKNVTQVPDNLVAKHCAFCERVRCAMYLKVEKTRKWLGPVPDFPCTTAARSAQGRRRLPAGQPPDRLLYPLIRRGGKGGTLERATWDEALDYIVSRWQAIQARARQGCRRRLQRLVDDQREVLPDREVRPRRPADAPHRLQRPALHVVGGEGLRQGVRHRPRAAADDRHPAGRLHPGRRLERRRVLPDRDAVDLAGARPGASLIVVDPRETPIARTADLWLPVKPGTDVALLNAMLRRDHPRRAGGRGVPRSAHHRLGRGARKRSRTVHAGAGRAALRRAGGERSWRRRGSTGGRATSLIMHARGIEHSTHGVNNCLACINLALARGQVGKPGGGTMMLTGQGNGQGGREVGQKANQFPATATSTCWKTGSTSPMSGASRSRSCRRRAPPPPRWCT